MVITNFHFFNKFGKNLNLQYDTDNSIWTGRIFFKNISINLFDNENIFILEKVGADYKFPTISQAETLRFEWENFKNSDQIFFYNVIQDTTLNENFLNKIESAEFTYDDFKNSPEPSGDPQLILDEPASLDLKMPLQVNIAFSPTQEISYQRTLLIKIWDGTQETIIAKLEFYGEGEEEEERFKVWTENFGIKFQVEDANILKDYDIKEANPDMVALNKARKSLLVTKEEVFPYVGTYKGLLNFINLLGYKDVLNVKEYWQNINPKSAYFNTLSMVDITDYLDNGQIDTLNYQEANKSLKSGRQFKKTEFLALVYEFTTTTGQFDDDGIPIIEETTEFTVDEIFYKLNLLNTKLKNEFLPINVKIKDIIGEFIYFQKVTINYWPDSTTIFDYNLNDKATVISWPDENTNLVLRSLDPLIKQKSTNGIDFGTIRFNQDLTNPFELGQKYPISELDAISELIKTYYTSIKDQRFPNLGETLSWEYGDDPQRLIGAPIIFSINIPKFTLFDLRSVKLEEFSALTQYWRLNNIDFKNYFEINWRIIKSGENPYNFEYRGPIGSLTTLPHYLPYAGDYRVIIELFDFYGGVSVFSKKVTVLTEQKPEIIAFTKLEDKFNYQLSNLTNCQLRDFGASYLYYPRVNVLDNESVGVTPYKNLTEFASFFKNRYGLGQNIYDAEIYDEATQTYVPYFDPFQSHQLKRYWGFGEFDFPITLRDYRDLTLDSLYYLRLNDLVWTDDFSAGFYFNTPTAGDLITLSGFTPYQIPSFTDLDDLCTQLNESTHPAISLFTYDVLNSIDIHAQARFLSKELYHIIEYSRDGGVPTTTGDQFTYFLPRGIYSPQLINHFNLNYPNFKEENLFLFAKTSDILSNQVSNINFWSPQYLQFIDNKQIGFLPTTIDQNVFNIDDIKIFNNSFQLPENGIGFFIVNNLDGKSDFIWSLTDVDTQNEIFRVKSVPFFVWKFKDVGNFTLSVEVIDNRGAHYFNQVENFIQVLNKRDYIISIEERLEARKNKLILEDNL